MRMENNIWQEIIMTLPELLLDNKACHIFRKKGILFAHNPKTEAILNNVLRKNFFEEL